MKIKCKACKTRFKPPARGRRPRYCSRACRQKAYRQRMGTRTGPGKALENDLFAIRDRTARARGAVRVLEELGFEVGLTRRSGPPLKKKRPPLRSV